MMKKKEITDFDKMIMQNVATLKLQLQKNNRKSKNNIMGLFTSWITQCYNTSRNPFENYNIIWKNHKLSKAFLKEVSHIYLFDEITTAIFTILMGNFQNIEQIHHMRDYNINGIFLYPISQTYKILFGIYFQYNDKVKHFNEDCIEEKLKFLNIVKEKSTIEFVKNKFIENILKKRSKFPIIEIDNDIIKDPFDIFFMKSIISKGKSIKYPFAQISISSKHLWKSKEIMSQKIEEGFNHKDFEISRANEFALKSIQNYPEPMYNIISSIFDEEILKMELSEQEISLIQSKENIIMSGRPGTGKTTVLLFKLLASFLNFQLHKSMNECNDIDWDLIRQNISNPCRGESFRVVFTSLSSHLCSKVEEMYSTILSKMKWKLTHPILKYNDMMFMNCLRDVRTFPLFINFRKLIFLIDGTLNFQFFQRQINNIFPKMDAKCDLIFNPETLYRCNDYKDPQLDFDCRSFFIRSPVLVSDSPVIKKEINESNFDLFFHKTLYHKLRAKAINAQLGSIEIYCQIYSVIKGSLTSHLSYLNGISREEYHSKGRKITDLTEEQRDLIYDIYMSYETWKRKNAMFDFQDVVNHLIRQVKVELSDIKLIDYIFIDEVQDLSINQIYLLILVTRHPRGYAGDTCQTISKVIRFRFCDLFSIFYTFSKIIPKFKKPQHESLSCNFRFNSKILKLANFIFELISKMFPNTLDKFKLDFTTKITMFHPCVMDNIEELIKNIAYHPKEQNNFTFSFYHCFICRNEAKANDLKEKIHSSILTSYVEKCKGLEYEIVVVYNFFKDSTCKKIWETLLRSITYEVKENENLSSMEIDLKKCENIEEIKNEYRSFICPKFAREFDKHDYFEFCTELKELFVSITRARSFLIFYDEDSEVFPTFVQFFLASGLLIKEGDSLIDRINMYLLSQDTQMTKKNF